MNGGSLQGIISDSSGALVPGASVCVAATDTGEVVTVKTDASGFYTVGPLNPGNYRVTVSATGFETLIVNTVIRTATATAGSFQLKVGAQTVTVEVTEGEVQLNTDQPSISGVVSSEQFQSLPVDGRNVLDYAQFQPGVQLQAGGIADGGFIPPRPGTPRFPSVAFRAALRESSSMARTSPTKRLAPRSSTSPRAPSARNRSHAPRQTHPRKSHLRDQS